MSVHSIHLRPDDDLRSALQTYALTNDLKTGYIVTCVGSVKSAALRMAGATPDKQAILSYDQKFEIVSLVGTLTADDCHLHISLARSDGSVIGGHLKDGTIIDTTAEIVVGEDEHVLYGRALDPATGFPELDISPRPVAKG